MRIYISELSKFIIVLLMVSYTLCSFAVLALKLERKKSVYVIQCVLVFLTHFIMFASLAAGSGETDYLFFYLFVQVLLLAIEGLTPVIYEKANLLLLSNTSMLIGTGFAIVSRLSFQKSVRQYVIMLAAFTAALFIPWGLGRLKIWKKLTWAYGLAGVLALGVVLFMGEVTHGSKLSFSISELTFQPSEFVKILFIFFLAGVLWEKGSFANVVLSAVPAGVCVILLVLSKDLGSALIFFVVYVFVVFAATRNYLYLAAGAVGGSGAACVAYRLFDHVRARVTAWINPWDYIDNKGYAITQSLFAIGSGSWFGVGLLKGNPTTIPYVEADFVFSAVCEELGGIFGVCLILVIICCFLSMMKIAACVRDRFYQLIVYGIGIMYIFQNFLTVGGGVKLIPLTGVTLPFISYGGSSCMTTMFMFFIVQGIYIRLQQEGGKEDACVETDDCAEGGENEPMEEEIPMGEEIPMQEEREHA